MPFTQMYSHRCIQNSENLKQATEEEFISKNLPLCLKFLFCQNGLTIHCWENFGWLIMDDLGDKLLGEFRPHLRDKLLENFLECTNWARPVREGSQKQLSNWKAEGSWQTWTDFLGKAMSGKYSEEVGFGEVIGKQDEVDKAQAGVLGGHNTDGGLKNWTGTTNRE